MRSEEAFESGNNLTLLQEAFIEELNEKITGAVSEHKKYGWLAYYVEINDLTLLFRLDRITRNLVSRSEVFNEQEVMAGLRSVRRLSKALYELRHRPRDGYVYNYDQLKSPSEKRAFLARRRGVPESKFASWSDELIEENFLHYRNSQLRQLDADHGTIS